MATVLGLVAVLGIVWLVRSATTNSENTAGVDTTNSTDTPDGTATDGGGTPDGGRDSGGTPNGGKSPGGGKTPGGSRPAVHLNGVNLQGGGDLDGCVTVINKTSTPVDIESVSFVIVHGPPGKATVGSDNGAHCFNEEGDEKPGPPCLGHRLIEGKQCLTGAVLAPNAKPGEYTIDTVIDASVLCDNDQINPCNYVKDWHGPPPTPQAPVQVQISRFTSERLRSTIVVEGTGPSPSEDSSSPDTPSVPEISPSPEVDNPPLPDTSPSLGDEEDEGE